MMRSRRACQQWGSSRPRAAVVTSAVALAGTTVAAAGPLPYNVAAVLPLSIGAAFTLGIVIAVALFNWLVQSFARLFP